VKLYHGTNSYFTKFDFSRAGKITLDMSPAGVMGAFFTPDRKYAEDYAIYAARWNGGQATILTADVKISNPAQYHNADLEALESPEAALELKQRLIEEGYDGLEIYAGGRTEYCAFFPKQIKNIREVKQ